MRRARPSSSGTWLFSQSSGRRSGWRRIELSAAGKARYRGLLGPVFFTVALLALIALSLQELGFYLGVVLFGSVALLVAAFHVAFPGSRFFSFAFANLIGIYAVIFGFFLEGHFREVDRAVVTAGFVAPLVAFLLGVLWRRHAIRAIVFSTELREERRFGRALIWLVPVFIVGALTFLIPDAGMSSAALDAIFLAAMGTIAAIVLVASRDVAVFLLDTGLLFEEFFGRAARLIVPAFAFLTFYSLVVILFAAVFSALDRLTQIAHFRIDGAVRPITFAESLYFSVTTLSTVGYGDISPATGLARVLVGLEIVTGVLLLIFGVNEILNYSRGRRE
ncbi:MAG TPA: ion channel [Stellaceae bacterium]|nr:ion channel [Stellaceae bacterium]